MAEQSNNIKKSRSLIFIGIFIFFLFLAHLWTKLFLFKSLPKTLFYFVHNQETVLKHPYFIQMILGIILDLIKPTLSSVGLLLGAIFIIRSKNWARLLVIYSCSILLGILIFQFVKSYSEIYIHLNGNACLQEMMKEYVGVDPQLFLSNKWPYIQTVLVQMLCYLLPIYFLTLPKIKRQFNDIPLITPK